MAFKMKGSAFKLNKVATKSTMKMAKKAMKMKEEESAMDMKEKSPMELKTSYKMKEAMAKMKDESAMKQTKPDYPDIDGDGNTTESMKQAAADKKSGMKQKITENPNARTSNYWRGYTGESGRTASGLGKTTRYEDKFYRENPYMSPTAEEQDIFVGKDIEETRDQYKPYKGKRYAVSETGKAVTQQEDMGGNQFNDEAFINYAKKLEREKEMRESEDQ